MKFIAKEPERHLYKIMQSVDRDRKSWEGWYGLQISVPDIATSQRRQQINSDICEILDRNLKSEHAEAIYDGDSGILVLCKDTDEKTLEAVGWSILDYAVQEAHVRANFMLFDIFRDAAMLLDGYSPSCLLKASVRGEAFHLDRPKKGNAHYCHNNSHKSDTISHLKVLLVEDDPVVRWMVRTSLKDCCYLATAQESKHAIHMYQSYKPDIVFLDIGLPGEDGGVILEKLLTTDPGARIVMFSGHDEIENITSFMEKGARGFIAKPFNKERFLHYIQQGVSG